jgi:hypothetical protein
LIVIGSLLVVPCLILFVSAAWRLSDGPDSAMTASQMFVLACIFVTGCFGGMALFHGIKSLASGSTDSLEENSPPKQ